MLGREREPGRTAAPGRRRRRRLQESKNERLNTLLEKTSELLEQLGDKIRAQQARLRFRPLLCAPCPSLLLRGRLGVASAACVPNARTSSGIPGRRSIFRTAWTPENRPEQPHLARGYAR